MYELLVLTSGSTTSQPVGFEDLTSISGNVHAGKHGNPFGEVNELGYEKKTIKQQTKNESSKYDL